MQAPIEAELTAIDVANRRLGGLLETSRACAGLAQRAAPGLDDLKSSGDPSVATRFAEVAIQLLTQVGDSST